MKRGENNKQLEYFTNNQAHESNDRAFSGTGMQQHHQDIQDFNLFFNFNRLCIYFKEFQYYSLWSTTTNNFSSYAEVLIGRWGGEILTKYLKDN